MVVKFEETREPVARFVCKTWPKLRIRHLQFDKGELLVYADRDIILVEHAHGYGNHIMRVPLVDAPAGPTLQDFFQPTMTPAEPMPRQGMRTATIEGAAPVQNAPPPEPEPEPDVPPLAEPTAHQPELISKGGGWYEWQGANYRKNDLPPEAAELLG